MKFLFSILCIYSIYANIQNLNNMKSFDDLFTNEKKIKNLLNAVQRFKKFFNIEEKNVNEDEIDNSKESKHSSNSDEIKDQLELDLIDDFNKPEITCESQDSKFTFQNSLYKINLININSFSQTNPNLITFIVIFKFNDIKPSNKISFTIKLFFKKKKDNKQQNSTVICESISSDYNKNIIKYNCKAQIKSEVEFISLNNNFLFDGKKYDLKDIYVNPEYNHSLINIHKQITEYNFNHNEIYNNNYFYIKGSLSDLIEDKINFTLYDNSERGFTTNVMCSFLNKNENDYKLKCQSEKNFKRQTFKVSDIVNEILKKINLNEQTNINKNEKYSKGLPRHVLIIIIIIFSILITIIIISLIILRKQTIDLKITIRVSLD